MTDIMDRTRELRQPHSVTPILPAEQNGGSHSNQESSPRPQHHRCSMTPASNERVSDERLSRFIETCTSMGDAGDGERYAWWDDLTLALRELQALRSQSPEPSSSEPVATLGQAYADLAAAQTDTDADIAEASSRNRSALYATFGPTPSQPVTGEEEGERDIFECSNQLAGYVGPDTPEHLASFLMRESEAAAKLADSLIAARAELRTAEARLSAVEVALKEALSAMQAAEDRDQHARFGANTPREDAEVRHLRTSALRRAREALTTITGGENER